ncbi:MAG: hypothetical protein ACPGZP_03430 [Panacagrimonas sp.]
MRAEPLVEGVIWQPSDDYPAPQGNWQRLGADTLLIQWLANDGYARMPGTSLPARVPMPQWSALAEHAWAGRMIVGLASRADLEAARREADALAAQSLRLATKLEPKPAAWYAPVEISPDWNDAEAIARYLGELPRPLYVSAYGGYQMSDTDFVEWVLSWLPSDVTLLYQDGVGVGRQSVEQARRRADLLAARLGHQRFAIVLEAFRETVDGRFKPAPLWRVAKQLRRYRGLRVYLFSARHLTPWRVRLLRLLTLTS